MMIYKLLLLFVLLSSLQLQAEVRLLAFAGSTRKDSYNKMLVQQAARYAEQDHAHVTIIDLADYPMPFYNADLEKASGMPSQAKKLRDLMIESDAIIIASPEYNGSLSALLKNAIDWTSRSEDGQSSRAAFQGKKFALMSASLGTGGGARGLVHLRSIIQNIGGDVIEQQVCVPSAYQAFTEQGELKEESLRNELKQEVEKTISCAQ